jgi:hypothetical protein
MGIGKFFTTNKKNDHQALELIITEQSIQAVLWEIGDQVQTLKTGQVHQYTNTKDLIIKADQAIQDLGKEAQKVSQVVFALELAWIDQNGILPEHKQLLKKLTKDLSLEAVGFIVISEALSQHLVEDNPQISSLLIQVEKQKVSLSLIQDGDLQKTESLNRSDDTLSDILEGLARLKGSALVEETLPAQLFLTSLSSSLEDLYAINQTLISYNWQEKNIFSSAPIVKTLDTQTAIQALTTQSGKALAQNQKIPLKQETPTSTPAQTTGKSFGIPIKSELPTNQELIPEETPSPEIKTKKTPKNKNWLQTHKIMILLGFVGGLLTLLIIGFGYLITTAQAIISITPQKESLNQDVQIELDPEIAESDFDNLILKANTTFVEIEAEQTIETTGVKLVGEKATGQVNIINKTTSEKTFNAGTTLYYQELRYTLNDDVKVASASIEEKTGEEVKTYGTASVQVTAVNIGAEGNLDKDTDLRVEDFADNTYKAVVGEDGLSGGSSRELRVVSEDDQASLISSTTKEVLREAEEEFANKSGGEEDVIPTQTIEVVNQKFDAEIGDETKKLTLTLNAKVKGIAYQKSDLKPLAAYVLTDLVPEGYKLADKDPQILSDLDEEASGSAITLQANINSQVWAEIDQDQVKSEIKGQNISTAENILRGKSAIKKVEINLNPSWLKSIWARIPTQISRIILELE